MATSTSQAPLTQVLRYSIPAAAGGADSDTPIGAAPFAGVVTAVKYTPVTVLTGADANSRTISLRNKGLTGAGSTSVASKAFVNGVNAPAMDQTDITLSGTPANLDVAEGDVLALYSLHIGTGIADPGGLVEVTLSRA